MAKYCDIVTYLMEIITGNQIKVDQKLPSIRELSNQFKCSKVTVVRAYLELQQKHIIYSIPQKGYYLVNKNKQGGDMRATLIDFASASPDESILPYRDFQHCLNQAIDQYEQALFNYTDIHGLPSLLDVLVKYLQDDQVFTKRTDLFITSGAQQAIHLLSSMIFPNSKTNILVEQPTYHGMIKLLEVNQLPTLGVERGFNGIDLSELEQKFATNNIKFFYTNPRFHNPLGTSFSRNEKKEIVKLAEKYDVYIVEDDYLSDLETKNNTYPLYYEDMNSRVIYIKSFSKVLLPGLRVAVVVVPSSLAESFAKHKKWMDLGTSVLSQGALEIYIKSGMAKAHQVKIRKMYEEKMAWLNQKVQSMDQPNLQWHVPHSGFFASAEILTSMNVEKLITRLNEKNIRIQSIGENYSESYDHDKILKLCVSKPTLQQITRGIDCIINEMNAIVRSKA